MRLCRPGDLARTWRSTLTYRIGCCSVAWLRERESFLVIAVVPRVSISAGKHDEYAIILRTGREEGLWHVDRDQLLCLS